MEYGYNYYFCLFGSAFLVVALYYNLIYKGYHQTKEDLKTPASLKKAYPILF